MRIFRDESGAITIDWVVLCSVLVGLAIGVVATISGPTSRNAQNLGLFLAAQSVDTY